MPVIRWVSATLLGMLVFTGILVVRAEGREATLTTDEGRTFSGELVSEGPEEVVLLISGIRTPFDRDRIASIEYAKTLAEAYAGRRKKIDDDDLEGRFELALWLAETRKALDMALGELDEIEQAFDEKTPQTLREKVQSLRLVVENRLKLREQAKAEQTRTRPDPPRPDPEAAAGPDPEAPDPEAPGEAGAPEDWRLGDEQINEIRVLELEEPPIQTGLRIPREVAETLIERYGDQVDYLGSRSQNRRWLALPDRRKIRTFFEVRARELYHKIEVRRDPPALRAFRQIHRTYILAYCATSECHGGTEGAGDLGFWSGRGQNHDRTVYTNFMVLDSYENRDGQMIDRVNPERSLLLQYGLPSAETSHAHPEVEGYRPRLLNERHPQYRAIHDWIGSLYRPRPEYNLQGWSLPAAGGQAPEEGAAEPEAEEEAPDGA